MEAQNGVMPYIEVPWVEGTIGVSNDNNTGEIMLHSSRKAATGERLNENYRVSAEALHYAKHVIPVFRFGKLRLPMANSNVGGYVATKESK